jgi:hypothetical protein
MVEFPGLDVIPNNSPSNAMYPLKELRCIVARCARFPTPELRGTVGVIGGMPEGSRRDQNPTSGDIRGFLGKGLKDIQEGDLVALIAGVYMPMIFGKRASHTAPKV